MFYLLETRLGHGAEVRFLGDFAAGHLIPEHVAAEDWLRIAELVHIYSDLPLCSVDSSILATAERLSISDVATLDRAISLSCDTTQPRHRPQPPALRPVTVMEGHLPPESNRNGDLPVTRGDVGVDWMAVLAGREVTALNGGPPQAANALSVIRPRSERHGQVTAGAANGQRCRPEPSGRGPLSGAGVIESCGSTGVPRRHLKTLHSSGPRIFGVSSAGLFDRSPDQHGCTRQHGRPGDGEGTPVAPRHRPGDEANGTTHQRPSSGGADGLSSPSPIVRGVGRFEAQARHLVPTDEDDGHRANNH